jgi:phosphatidylinositol phospholipase C beta
MIAYYLFLQESGTLEPKCLVKVDENGFFIYWKSEGRVSYVSINQ